MSRFTRSMIVLRLSWNWIDWIGLSWKRFTYFKILHFFGRGSSTTLTLCQHRVKYCVNTVPTNLLPDKCKIWKYVKKINPRQSIFNSISTLTPSTSIFSPASFDNYWSRMDNLFCLLIIFMFFVQIVSLFFHFRFFFVALLCQRFLIPLRIVRSATSQFWCRWSSYNTWGFNYFWLHSQSCPL